MKKPDDVRKKWHIHRYVYLSHGNLEAMPNDEKGITVLCRCKICDKPKVIVYVEGRVIR